MWSLRRMKHLKSMLMIGCRPLIWAKLWPWCTSHPMGGHYLSGADRQTHARSDLPWLLVAGGEIRHYRACPHLRGRVFDYGKADCGTPGARCFYAGRLGFARPCAHRNRCRCGNRRLAAAFGGVRGFRQVSDGLLPGDVILTAWQGHANHAAFYLGNGEMLHHAYNQLSRREPYNDYRQSQTHSVRRLPAWRPEMIQAIENDLIHAVE